MPEEDRCTLSQPDHVHSPKKNLHFWACCEKSHGINQLGAQALQPNHIRSHHDQEKHIIDSLIENMWKAHYQKDLLQSLKQNASIKYIIYCSQVWNRHVFIKCTNKIILLVAGEDVHVKVVPVTPCISFSAEYWILCFPPQTIYIWTTTFFFFLRLWGWVPSDTLLPFPTIPSYIVRLQRSFSEWLVICSFLSNPSSTCKLNQKSYLGSIHQIHEYVLCLLRIE